METVKQTFVKQALAPILLASALTVGAAEPLDLNSASAQKIADTMLGVGHAKAAAIVEYRDEHGSFDSVDDLVLVQGIGEATIARNREKITVK